MLGLVRCLRSPSQNLFRKQNLFFSTSRVLRCSTDNVVERDGRQTPAMKQYFQMKQSAPGYLLLFQVGDFFEIFYEDAIKASKLLDITLTVRDKVNNSKIISFPISQKFY